MAPMPKKQFQWERDAEPDPDADLPAVGAREGRGGVQRKKEADAVFALAKELVSMAPHEWAHLPISDTAREHLAIARDLEGRARHRNGYRRQLLAVAGVLRKEDPDAIRAALDQDVGATPKDRALMEVEVWRTRLVEKGDEGVNALLELHPDGDRQHLRTLTRQARKEAKKGTIGKAHKALFAALRETMGV